MISDEYKGVAANSETLRSQLRQYYNQSVTSKVHIPAMFFSIQILFSLVTVIIAVLLACCKWETIVKYSDIADYNTSDQSQTLAIVLSFETTVIIFEFSVFVLDCLAVGFQKHKLNEAEEIYNCELEYIKYFRYLPVVTIILDGICILGIFAIIGIASIITCIKHMCRYGNKFLDAYYCCGRILVVSTVIFLSCTISNHFYYILIAFVNDTFYAGSITVYYFLVFFLYLYGFYLAYKLLMNSEWVCCYGYQQGRKIHCHLCLRIVFMIFVIIVSIGYHIMFTLFVIWIPIRKSISETPNSIFVVYQIPLSLLGGLAFYKLVTKTNLEEFMDLIIKKRTVNSKYAKSRQKHQVYADIMLAIDGALEKMANKEIPVVNDSNKVMPAPETTSQDPELGLRERIQ